MAKICQFMFKNIIKALCNRVWNIRKKSITHDKEIKNELHCKSLNSIMYSVGISTKLWLFACFQILL